MKCIIYIFCFCSFSLTAQTDFELEGRISGRPGRKTIAYATVFNVSSKKGTISNESGYYRIRVSKGDSLSILFIGYKRKTIRIDRPDMFHVIELEEDTPLLNEVVVKPAKDHNYLYRLVSNCRNIPDLKEQKAKAYYQLKSFKDNKQIELVEAYYNVSASRYHLRALDLKAGRIALKPSQNRLFVSLESSRAVLELTNRAVFPGNPMEVSLKTLKAQYFLSLDNTYLNEQHDSLYVVSFIPKQDPGSFFEGKIWLNSTKHFIEKITLNCPNALKHPFIALFKTDSILQVNFTITKSFQLIKNAPALHHIDFIYSINYKSRTKRPGETTYTIKTQALLYAYDYSAAFFIPAFKFERGIGDYRKINAVPYNDFFWKNNQEYRLNDSNNYNGQFFSDTGVINSMVLFRNNRYNLKGLFEYPYVHWSEKRISFRDVSSDTNIVKNSTSFNAHMYNLEVQLYLDVNSSEDSLQVITSTIFDPYASYYHLRIDQKASCFINLYFDLCEISRRQLEQKLKGKTNTASIKQTYELFLEEFEIQKQKFMRSTERGNNEKEMRKYNTFVWESLGIDNIRIFNPYPGSKD